MSTRKANGKPVVTAAMKRRIEKNRRDLAAGKSMSLGDFLVVAAKADAQRRRNAAA